MLPVCSSLGRNLSDGPGQTSQKRTNEMVRRRLRLRVGNSQREDHRMHITSIGIDLGKTTFHLVALGERNKVLVRKKFSRSQLLAYTANLPSSLLGLEACAGAHCMGARLREQG